jgi:hypothetical protein
MREKVVATVNMPVEYTKPSVVSPRYASAKKKRIIGQNSIDQLIRAFRCIEAHYLFFCVSFNVFSQYIPIITTLDNLLIQVCFEPVSICITTELVDIFVDHDGVLKIFKYGYTLTPKIYPTHADSTIAIVPHAVIRSIAFHTLDPHVLADVVHKIMRKIMVKP